MKQNLILTGLSVKTEIPFSKMHNLTEETGHRHILKKRREGRGGEGRSWGRGEEKQRGGEGRGKRRKWLLSKLWF